MYGKCKGFGSCTPFIHSFIFAPQGSPGGVGSGTPDQQAGSGGGSTGSGRPYSNSRGPVGGGIGTVYSISGSDVTYAGGGGGGRDSAPDAAGGAGGGGAGGSAGSSSGPGAGTAATANTGGGGGGGGTQASPSGAPSAQVGAAGGSGVVIFSEPKGNWTTSGVYNLHDQFFHKINGDWG